MQCSSPSSLVAAATPLFIASLAAQVPQFRDLPLLDHAPGQSQAFAIGAVSTGAAAPDLLFVGDSRFDHLGNDGQGRFTALGTLPAMFRLAELADVDGDGDDDLVCVVQVSSTTREFHLYRFTGGAFVRDPSVAVGASNALNYMLPGDVDGDGDIDVVLDNALLPPVLLRNDGTGRFVSLGGRFTVPVGLARAALADIDGDGDLDFLRHLDSDFVRAYANDGTGRFSPSTLTVGPQVGYPARAVLVDDYDADGDVDVAVEVLGFGGSHGTWVFYNDGSGNMQSASTSRDIDGGFTTGRLVADLDGDGRPEYLQCFGRTWRVLRSMFGAWIDVSSAVLPNEALGLPVLDVVRRDLDGDGREDLACLLENGARAVLLATPSGGYSLARRDVLPLDAYPAEDVAVADLDGDGRDDVLCATSRGLEIYEVTDSGQLVRASWAPSISGVLHEVLAEDLDGDGRPDIAVGGHESGLETVQIWLAGGGGAFSQQPIDPTIVAAGAFGLSAGDLNGDGQRELAVSAVFETTILLVQRGWVAAVPLPVSGIQHTEFVDLDGNGRDELIGAGASGLFVFEHQLPSPSRLNLVDITQARFVPDAPWGGKFGLGDIDGDGDRDLVMQGYLAGAPTAGLILYTNDGSNQFAGSMLSGFQSGSLASIQIEDVDLDGRSDLVLVSVVAGASEVRFGRAGGPPATVAVRGALPVIAQSTLADLDGDGDLDLIAGRTEAQRLGVFTNIGRQVRQPDLARPGGSFDVELTWKPGSGAAALCLPVVGTRSIPRGLSLPGIGGSLFVDPLGVVGLPFTTVAGGVVLQVSVPATPSLSGLDIFTQGLWVDGVDLHWSNVCPARIR